VKLKLESPVSPTNSIYSPALGRGGPAGRIRWPDRDAGRGSRGIRTAWRGHRLSICLSLCVTAGRPCLRPMTTTWFF